MFNESTEGQTQFDPEAERLGREYEKFFADQSIHNPDLYKWGALWVFWQAAYAAGLAAREDPKGWKLVPVEMNGAMLQIMTDCEKEERLYSKREAWAALLAASPNPKD